MRPRALSHGLPLLLALACLAACSEALNTDAVLGSEDDDGGLDPTGTDICGNGLDDNGDGSIDEDCPCDPGTKQACYSGPPETKGVGSCTEGEQECISEYSGEFSVEHWGPCIGDTTPQSEACDGADNDCDGTIDDSCGGCSLPLQPNATSCIASSGWGQPIVKCQWSDPPNSVLASPIVVDLDQDGTAEIVFQAGTLSAGVSVIAIRGSDCSVVWSAPTGESADSYEAELAAGDVTGDGKPDVVWSTTSGQRILVVSHDGSILVNELANLGGTYDAAAIADIDGAPPAEIVVGRHAYRLDGGTLVKLWSKSKEQVEEFNGSNQPIVADVDLDGNPDVVLGNRILDAATGSDKTPAALSQLAPAYPALVQFDDSTPEPEVILTAPLSVVHPVSGAVVFGPYGPYNAFGLAGRPISADFDGDCVPEIGVADYLSYRVFDDECAVEPLPAKCAEPGVLWKYDIIDTSSAVCTAAAFDFDGDGVPEIAYRDHCWLRIFDGRTGKVVSALPMTSNTAWEGPTVADVDGDGHAEIIVSSAGPGAADECATEATLGTPWTATSPGVYVLQHADNCWAPARSVWNQHSYHVTNINEDSAIPVQEQPFWTTHNGFRLQVSP